MVALDCRGCEFTEFHVGDNDVWTCRGIDSNVKFQDVKLGEGEWYDYDEKAGGEVSIQGVRYELSRSK